MDVIRTLLNTNAARLVGYSSTAALAGALWLAKAAGIELSPEVQTAIGVIAAGIAVELIRKLVYSKQTTQALADNAAATGNTDIGTPPSGTPPLPPEG